MGEDGEEHKAKAQCTEVKKNETQNETLNEDLRCEARVRNDDGHENKMIVQMMTRDPSVKKVIPDMIPQIKKK